MENTKMSLANKENHNFKLSIEEKFLDMIDFWEAYKIKSKKTVIKCRSTGQKLRKLKSEMIIEQDLSCPQLIYPKKLDIRRKSSVLIAGELLEKFEKCKVDLKNDLRYMKKPCLTLRELDTNKPNRPRTKK